METVGGPGVHIREAQGRHFYQFYKGREDLFRIAVPFIRVGLESNEACIWIVSRAIGVRGAIEALQRECDLAPFVENSQLLILSAENWYLNRRRFSELKALEKMERFVEDKRRRGFSVCRGVGDLGWLDSEDWLEFQSYEQNAHHWIKNFRMSVICAYPIERCSVTQTRDILNYHDGVFSAKP